MDQRRDEKGKKREWKTKRIYKRMIRHPKAAKDSNDFGVEADAGSSQSRSRRGYRVGVSRSRVTSGWS
jgi:hypothetical protein